MGREPLTLEQYDHLIGFHLKMIGHYAFHISDHVDRMTMRPEFETLAEEQLIEIDQQLSEARVTVQHALRNFRSKPDAP